MKHAGVGSRTAAFLIDILPIVGLCVVTAYAFFDYGEVWQARRARPDDLELFREFVESGNAIRDSAFCLWLIYCTVLEASPWQGTIGKRLLGIRVVDKSGNRLTIGRSVGRNLAKILSYVPLGLGFLWAAFSKTKRTWHDRIAGTFVVHP